MALPKRKTSKARHKKKQSHAGYSLPTLAPCPQCHSPKPPHQVCRVCGSYRGREVYQAKEAEKQQ